MATETKGRKWGTDTYSKWDDLEETTTQEKQSIQPTTFTLGSSIPDEPEDLELKLYYNGMDIKRFSNIDATNEVWALDLLPMRLFASSGLRCTRTGEMRAARPLIIMLSSLYPIGRLIEYRMCENNAEPHKMPTVLEVVRFVKEAMINPQDKGAQRRPSKIVFTSAYLYHWCKTSLKEVSVEPCWVENVADGLGEYVKEISKKMLDEGRADRDEKTADEKSMESMFGKTATRSFYGVFKEILVGKPWETLNERQCMRVEGVGVGGRPIWVSTIGSGQGGTDGLFGVAVFRSRMDLERRMAGGKEIWRPQPRCARGREKNGVDGVKLKRCKPPLYDTVTGEELVFASGEAQKEVWGKVKKTKAALEEREEGIKNSRDWWGESEMSSLFKHITNVAFDELDSIDAEGYEVGSSEDGVGGRDDCIYPHVAKVIKGDMVEVGKEDIWTAFVAAKVVLDVCRRGKKEVGKATWETSVRVGGEDVVFEPTFEAKQVKVEWEGEEKVLEYKYEPVWFVKEVEKVAEIFKRQQAEKEEVGGGVKEGEVQVDVKKEEEEVGEEVGAEKEQEKKRGSSCSVQ